MAALASVPVVVRVDAASPTVPAPGPVAPRNPLGSLPVTGIELVLLVLAVVALGVGAVLVRAAR